MVASSQPLPAYNKWQSLRGKTPWGKHAVPPGVVWFDDGAFLETMTPMGHDRSQRGKGQPVGGNNPVVQLTDWLRQAPQVEAVGAVGFAVLPKKE